MPFPITIDDTFLKNDKQWVVKLRDRYIGDFRQHANDKEYQKQLKRLVADLERES